MGVEQVLETAPYRLIGIDELLQLRVALRWPNVFVCKPAMCKERKQQQAMSAAHRSAARPGVCCQLPLHPQPMVSKCTQPCICKGAKPTLLAGWCQEGLPSLNRVCAAILGEHQLSLPAPTLSDMLAWHRQGTNIPHNVQITLVTLITAVLAQGGTARQPSVPRA